MNKIKQAVLTMDVEDWYHLDYFNRKDCNEDYSMLDGLNNYLEILENYCIPSNFFVLGELAIPLKNILREIAQGKHEISSHGWNHKRPMKLNLQEFKNDIIKSKDVLEDITGQDIIGYRAPCFSMDRNRVDLLIEAGYSYDSSKIKFTNHPLYGDIDLFGFETLSPNIYKFNNFYEFEISTENILGRNIPVSGGGYIRLLPWLVMKKMISSYLSHSDLYIFYIHPFEFSFKKNPIFPKKSKWNEKHRFSFGRDSVTKKFQFLLEHLKLNGFEFTTFKDMINQNEYK